MEMALSTVTLSVYRAAGMCTSSPGLAASMQAWMVAQPAPTVKVVANGMASGAAQATPAGCWASINTAADANRPAAKETKIRTNRLCMLPLDRENLIGVRLGWPGLAE